MQTTTKIGSAPAASWARPDSRLATASRVSCHERPWGTEIHAALTPVIDARAGGRLESQLRSCYDALAWVLSDTGAAPTDVVAERLHCADVEASAAAAAPIRDEFYGSPRSQPRPASSILEQPPARPGQIVALQVQVVRPRRRRDARTLWTLSPTGYGHVRVRDEGDIRWIHLGNCAPASRVRDPIEDPASFEAQSDEMFRQSSRLLEQHGARFTDVVRTWIFVKDIDRDYDGLNRSRGRFFRSEGIDVLPASTGIQGHPAPASLLCAMDVLSIQGPFTRKTMHAPTLNEAPAYGSLFARGMRVEADGTVYLFISGTASIDDAGHIVHVGDRTSQTRRMYLNIRNLLEAQGARMEDLVTLTSYLKDRDFYHEFVALTEEAGVPASVPDTVVHAGVCRPDWLVEVEGLAILPASP